MADTFCPRCGAARVGAFRFCRGCGLDLDALPAPPAPQPGPSSAAPLVAPVPALPDTAATPAAAGVDPETYKLLTMIAWLACGLFTGWLGLVQLGYANTILDNGSLTALGGLNLATAAIVVFGAVRLQRSPRHSYRTSALWAVLVVVLQGLQITGGATHFAFVGATMAAAAAGVLAVLTYQALPPEGERA